uniref:Putative peptide 14.4 kDa n=1 Tax=Ixodes pacificus TaxID=29930 RepID=Q6B877_IXOPA|nr:putative peptide 14.4 kDa [Ixodes pacificus]
MFKLSFFVVFVLAGLCFGASDTEEGTNNSGGASSGGSSSSVGDDSHKAEETPKESSSDVDQKPLGYHLPDFIGNEQAKKSYVSRLVSLCTVEHHKFKINEHNITFPQCTFSCISESGGQPTKNLRIPEGMVCNKQNDTCPKTGDCPEVKEVPSC